MPIGTKTTPTKSANQQLVISLPLALPHQVPILLDPARFKVIVCGRRWGKTALGLMAAVKGHGPHRGSRRGAIDGAKIWWVSPDYKTADEELWPYLKRTAASLKHISESKMRVTYPSGGSVTIRTAHEPGALVAVGLDGIVIDEAGKTPADAWTFLRPAIADREGWCVFIGTPRGYNWFYDKFEFAADREDWARWHQPSSANPLMTLKELNKAKEESPRLYGQEYEARFESPEGAEWPPTYFPPSIWFTDWPSADRVALSVIAVDPSLGKGGKKKGHYAFIVYGALDRNGVLWCEAWGSQTWDGGQLAEKIVEKWETHRANEVVFEDNGGQAFLGFLTHTKARERGVGIPLASVTHGVIAKEDRIRASLTGPLQRGEIRLRDTPNTRTLCQQLREFPVGEFDDGCDALAMAVDHVHVLLRGGRKKQKG
jgi:hypothetical protein